jgi:hypothetical protein
MNDILIQGHVDGDPRHLHAVPIAYGEYLIDAGQAGVRSWHHAVDMAEERIRALFDNRDAQNSRWGLQVKVGRQAYAFGVWSHRPRLSEVIRPTDPIKPEWDRYDAGRTPKQALQLARVIVERYVGAGA